MPLRATTLTHLTAQADLLRRLAEGASPAALDARPASDAWSAREILAHLARHQAVFLERLRRIVAEDEPELGRYQAEEDAEWPAWRELPVEEILRRHAAGRAEMMAFLEGLAAGDAERRGEHPRLGAMTLERWVELFLVHEGHHLYVLMKRLGPARSQTDGAANALGTLDDEAADELRDSVRGIRSRWR